MPISARRRSLIAVIGSMVVVNLVYGLTLPLLSLILDAQGISKSLIGLSILVQASAGVVLVPFMPRIILRVGAAPVMRYATLTAAGAILALGLLQDVYVWLPIRFLLGAAAAILWSASEAMINELADDRWRGRIIGAYSAAGAAGFALGPLVLIVTGTSGFLPFGVTAALIATASLPLLIVSRTTTAPESAEHPSLWRIFSLAPHFMLLNFTYAAAIEAFIAFFPLLGIHIGLGEARSLSLLTVFALGGVILQLPLGWLADHMPRRRLLLLCIVATIAGFWFLPLVVQSPLIGPAFAFTLGGVEGMIYALGIILLGQRFRGAELAAASVLYTGMWGAGMMVGPAAIGFGLDLFGYPALTRLIAGLYLAYLISYTFLRPRGH